MDNVVAGQDCRFIDRETRHFWNEFKNKIFLFEFWWISMDHFLLFVSVSREEFIELNFKFWNFLVSFLVMKKTIFNIISQQILKDTFKFYSSFWILFNSLSKHPRCKQLSVAHHV